MLHAAVVAALATHGIAGVASADTVWKGNTGSQDWTLSTNWTGGVPSDPSNNGTTFINTASAGNYPVYSAGTSVTDWDIIIGDGSGVSGRLDQTAGTLSAGNGNWAFVGTNAGTGTFNILGTANFNAGAINVGAWTGGTSNGTVTVNTGGTVNLTAGNGRAGYLDASLLVAEGGGNNSGTFNLALGTVNTSYGTVIGHNTTGSGTFNMSGGMFNNTGEFQVGRSATGTVVHSNGTINSTSYFVIGRESGSNGTYTLSGGTVNAATSGGFAVIGSFAGAKGALTVSGGVFNAANASPLYVGESGTGTMTVSGTGLVTVTHPTEGLRVGRFAGAVGTVNLNGGILRTTLVTRGAGTGTFNFDGGTLQASANNAGFMTGLSNAFVKSGGAIFDTGGFNITVGQALLADTASTGGGLTKNNSGTLTLNAVNTYTGGTTVNAGTLAVNAGGSAGGIRGTLTVNSGAVVNLTAVDALGYGTGTGVTQVNLNGGTLNNSVTGNNGYLASYTLTGGTLSSSGGGAININTGNGITANASATTSTISAPLVLRGGNTMAVAVADGAAATDLLISGNIGQGNDGAGGISKTGAGTLIVSGNATYTGPTNVSGGTLQFGNGNAATLGGGTYAGAINNTAALAFNSTANQALNGPITGGGALIKGGSGALTLGSTAALGAVTLTNGTLNVNGTTTAGNITVAGGTTLGTRVTAAGTNVLSLGGNNLTFDASTFAVNFNAISPTAAIVSLPAGTLTLNGAVTPSFTGTSGLSSGTYTLIDYGTLAGPGAFAGTTFALGARALGNVANDTANTAIVLNVTSDKPVWTGTNGSAWVEYAANTPTVTGNFALKSGHTATDFWTGDDVQFNDTYNLGAGDVAVTNGNVTIATGGAVNPAGVAPASVVFNNSAVDYVISGTGTIGGSGTLTKNGTGTLTLSTSNTYTGGTTINGGRIVINNANSLGAAGGALTLNAATLETTATITATRAVTLGSSASTIQTTGGTYALNGNVSGIGALNKTGPGTLSLGGSNTYSGGTFINGGTIVLTNTAGSANNGNFTLNNGALRYNAASPNFNLASAVTLNAAAVSVGNLGAQINLTGPINGNSNALAIASAATSVLYVNGVVTNVSGFDVQSGALGFDLNTANSRGTAPVNVASGAALWFAGNNASPIANNLTFNGGAGINGGGALYYEGGVPVPAALTGTITLAAGNTSIGSGFGDTIRLNGTVTGPGALTQLNANTVLNGNNDYAGGTTVAQKTLTAGTNTALGSGAVSVSATSGAQLALANGVSVSNALTLNGGGISGQGALHVPAGDATYAGPITVTGATQVGGHFASGTGTLTIDNAITSASTPVSVRAGTVLFNSTASSYSALEIRGGLLKIGADNVIPTTAAVTIGSSAAGSLDLNGHNQTLPGLTQTGNPAFVTNGVAATTSLLTTTGTSTFNGAINNGQGQTALTVASGALTVSGAGDFTGNIIVSGTLNAANGAITGGPRTTSPLGNAAVAGRTVTINNGGTVSLTVGNVIANGGVTTTPGLGFVVNAGGTLQTAAGNVGGPGGGDANTLGNITLNGGTFTTGNGYNADYQAAIINGTVTVGGASASTINTNATNTTANGIMLGGAAVGTNAITFNVADATGNNAADLAVSARLTNSAASTANPTHLGALNKTGVGKLALIGANTYGGGTTINNGTVRADAARVTSGSALTSSATGTGGVAVNNTGTLAGDGGTGDVSINSGGTITAGTGAGTADSIGTLHTGAQTWNANGIYAIKADGNAENAATAVGAGSAYDTQSITGLLNLASLGGGNKFTLSVVTLGSSAFVPGSYKIATAADGISYNDGSTVVVASAGTLLTDLFVLNVNNVGMPSGNFTVTAGQFGGGGSGGDLFLNYAPAPEPGTLVLGALAAWPVLSRRRRANRNAAGRVA